MKHPLLSLLGAITLFFTLACGGARAERSTALFEAGKAKDWTIVIGGEFYPLHGELDRHSIPRKGVPVPLHPLGGKHFRGFSLTSDGSRLVTVSTPFGDRSSSALMVFDSTFEPVAFETKTKYRGVTTDYTWSPDGKHISVARGNEVLVMNWATKEFRSLGVDHSTIKRYRNSYRAPSWNPDGTRLAYESNTDEVVIRDLEGVEIDRWPGRLPNWSPDGSTILYRTSEYRDRRRVQAYDVKTGETRELFAATTIEDHVFWSPDSKFVLFRRGVVNSIMGELHFYSVDDDKIYTTAKELPSTRDAQVLMLPDWVSERLAPYANNATENPNRRKAGAVE